MNPSFLVSEIREKEVGSFKAPSFPGCKSSSASTGFPEHKNRTRASAFKQKCHGLPTQENKRKAAFVTGTSDTQLASGKNLQTRPSGSAGANVDSDLRSAIDRENNARLASMSTHEIEEARKELLDGLDAATLQTLLRRANLDEKHGPSPFDVEDTQPVAAVPPEIRIGDALQTPSPAATAVDGGEEDDDVIARPAQALDESAGHNTGEEASTNKALPSTSASTHIVHDDNAISAKPHWPTPPMIPDLDPSHPNFLEALHAKYFPTLPADPSKLAWMAPLPTPNSAADYDSPYHPEHSSLPLSALRFDFRGAILPPRTSRVLPTNLGLHHHGEAPESAGYTVQELALLARSVVPGQRCIAYRTLGRVMYRLGKGEFGRIGDDVPNGVWDSMVHGKVLESLYEEARMDQDGKDGDGEWVVVGDGVGRGHRTAYAYAVEAIWMFEKGEWRESIRRGK